MAFYTLWSVNAIMWFFCRVCVLLKCEHFCTLKKRENNKNRGFSCFICLLVVHGFYFSIWLLQRFYLIGWFCGGWSLCLWLIASRSRSLARDPLVNFIVARALIVIMFTLKYCDIFFFKWSQLFLSDPNHRIKLVKL